MRHNFTIEPENKAVNKIINYLQAQCSDIDRFAVAHVPQEIKHLLVGIVVDGMHRAIGKYRVGSSRMFGENQLVIPRVFGFLPIHAAFDMGEVFSGNPGTVRVAIFFGSATNAFGYHNRFTGTIFDLSHADRRRFQHRFAAVQAFGANQYSLLAFIFIASDRIESVG